MSQDLKDKFYDAIASGKIEKIQAVLDQGAKINSKIYAGMTPVTVAARNGDVKSMIYLIEQGAKVDSYAIQVASMSRNSNEGIVKYLHLAQMKQVKPLVKGYSKADAKLLRAAYSGKLNSLNKAIQEGANLNASDEQDTSALRWACRWGHMDIVNALLDAGAEVDFRSNSKWTALMEAVLGGHEELLKLLIEKGADVNARTVADTSVLDFAHDIVPFLEDQTIGERMLTFLLEQGAK